MDARIDELKSIKQNISSKKLSFTFTKNNKCKNFKILNTKKKKYKSSYYALTIILKNTILCKEQNYSNF